MISESEFLDEVESIAKMFTNNNGTLPDLRKLERKLVLFELYKEWKSKETKYLAFFIKQIITVIWRNFYVDSPVDMSTLPEKEKRLNRAIGSFLSYAVKSIKANSNDESYMKSSYVLNELFEIMIECEGICEQKDGDLA